MGGSPRRPPVTAAPLLLLVAPLLLVFTPSSSAYPCLPPSPHPSSSSPSSRAAFPHHPSAPSLLRPAFTASSVAVGLGSSLPGGTRQSPSRTLPPRTTSPAAQAASGSSSVRHGAPNDDDGGSSSAASSSSSSEATTAARSTLTHLSHVTVPALPTDDASSATPMSFYASILGCTQGSPSDDRDASASSSSDGGGDGDGGTNEWTTVNCGPNSKFRLSPIDEGVGSSQATAESLPIHVGLRYASLDGLKNRIEEEEQRASKSEEDRCFASCEIGTGPDGREAVTLVDRIGNVFKCRQGVATASSAVSDAPLSDTEAVECPSSPLGVDYVEFGVPRKTAAKIATFYDCVLDAPTSVVRGNGNEDGGGGTSDIVIVGIGTIGEDGRAEQSLLFRECDGVTTAATAASAAAATLLRHCGIGLCVGTSEADFDAAYLNCEQAGVVVDWVEDSARSAAGGDGGGGAGTTDTLAAARERGRFRFRDVVDLRDGTAIFGLKHEVRSA